MKAKKRFKGWAIGGLVSILMPFMLNVVKAVEVTAEGKESITTGSVSSSNEKEKIRSSSMQESSINVPIETSQSTGKISREDSSDVTEIPNPSETFISNDETVDSNASSGETLQAPQAPQAPQSILNYDEAKSVLGKSPDGKTIFFYQNNTGMSAVTIFKGNGTELKPGDTLKKGESLSLVYHFEIPDSIKNKIKKGDFYDFNLPKQFEYDFTHQDGKVLAEVNNSLIEIGQIDELENNKVRLVFTRDFQEFSNQYNLNCVLNFSGNVEKTATSENQTGNIEIPFTNNGTISNITVTDKLDANLSKVIESKEIGKDNILRVKWHIVVPYKENNQKSIYYKKGILKDTLPEGTSFVEGSFYPESIIKDVTINGNIASIKIPDSQDEDLIIRYTTEMKLKEGSLNDNSPELKNSAELTSKNHEKLTASASLKINGMISKGKGSVDRIVTENGRKYIYRKWPIHLNGAGIKLPGELIFTDYFSTPTKLESKTDLTYYDENDNPLNDTKSWMNLLDESLLDQMKDNLEVKMYDFDGKKNVPGFQLILKKGLEKPLDFTYYTKTPYDEKNDKNFRKNHSEYAFNGEVWGVSNSDSDGTIVNTGLFSKDGGEYHPETHSFSWSIRYLENKGTIIPAGTEINDTMEIVDHGLTEKEIESIGKESKDDADKEDFVGFVFAPSNGIKRDGVKELNQQLSKTVADYLKVKDTGDLVEITSENFDTKTMKLNFSLKFNVKVEVKEFPLILKYDTFVSKNICSFRKVNTNTHFKNTATQQNNQWSDWQDGYTKENFSIQKSGKFVEENGQKEILWAVNVKGNQGLVIKDAIQKGQTYVEGSLNVSEVSKDSENNNKNIVSTEQDAKAEQNAKNGNISINLDNSNEHIITYRVTYDKELPPNDKGETVFKNTAYLTGDNGKYLRASAKVSKNFQKETILKEITNTTKGKSKDAYQVEKDENGEYYLTYKITVNASKELLKNVVLQDKFGVDLTTDEITKKSIHILDINKKPLQDKELSNFSIEPDDHGFTIHFPKEIDTTYFIEYKGKIVKGTDSKVAPENSASISGDKNTHFEYSVDRKGKVEIETSSGHAQMETYDVALKKVDSKDRNHSLKGATFKLHRAENAIDNTTIVDNTKWATVYGETKTDENGIIIFTGLNRDTNYYLEETKAPLGYTKTSEILVFSIDENKKIQIKGRIHENGKSMYTVSNDGKSSNKEYIEIKNEINSQPLPTTGGNKKVLVTLVGLTLLLSSFAYFYPSLKKN